MSSFKIKEVIITSTQRETTVSLWKEWYNLKIVNETATSTDLKLETDEVIYKIEDGKDSGFHTLIMTDQCHSTHIQYLYVVLNIVLSHPTSINIDRHCE